jgi:signal transduction histidine kinase
VIQSFGQPALAFYCGDIEGSNTLSLIRQDHILELPKTLVAGQLTASLQPGTSIVDGQSLGTAISNSPLTFEEQQLVHHPRIALWCPFHHKDGHLLGLLLMGTRGDADPYRDKDIQELQRILDTAGLSFINSAAYELQREAEAMIRHLFQELKRVQAETAAEIARELHDEVINLNVRLNIQSLQRVVGSIHDDKLRQELDLVLDGEHNVIRALRRICEQLHPTGTSDPLGLLAVLRMQLQRIDATWKGNCTLHTENSPIALDEITQRELVRIMREAVVNATKHTDATEIHVMVRYPVTAIDAFQLCIRDNGSQPSLIKPKQGHYGIRNMQESARTINGRVEFIRELTGGTSVVVTIDVPRPVPTETLVVDNKEHVYV